MKGRRKRKKKKKKKKLGEFYLILGDVAVVLTPNYDYGFSYDFTLSAYPLYTQGLFLKMVKK